MAMNWKKWIASASVIVLTAGFSAAAGPEITQARPAPAPTPAPAPAPQVWVSSAVSGSGSYLGVDISEVTSDRVAPLKLKDEHGVEITMVDRDAPAGRAGLKEHDVILEFNGTRVEGEEQLKRLLHETPPGREVTLGISRDGQPQQIKVTLGDRRKMLSGKIPAHPMATTPRMPEMPEMPRIAEMPEIPGMQSFTVVRNYSSAAGMMVDNLTPQLGDFFGVKSGEGVLVRSVEKGSPAEAAGLKAGDVIVKVDNEKIRDRSDWRDALRKSGKVNVGVIREKREQNFTLTLPERRKRDDSRMRLRVMPGDGDEEDFDIDLSGIDELQKVMPEIRQQIEFALPQAQREVERAQVEVARAMRELQPELNKELKNAQKEVERELKDLQKELKQLEKEK
jgi:membrane-associated protease RseP (regulator of RpoE activity)